jgi:ribosome assembly protein RRB1
MNTEPSPSEPVKPSVWLPGEDMEEEEELDYDPTAYDCLTSLSLDWPSLSFDILDDSLGSDRSEFPHTLSMVAGTQALPGKSNYLAVMRVSNLTRGKHGPQKDNKDDSDDDIEMLESDGEEEEDAVFNVRKFAHKGGVNRVRCMPQNGCIIASWSDTAQVQVWDVSELQQDLVAQGRWWLR